MNYIYDRYFDTKRVLSLFTTRFGGQSQAPYHSLNLAFHVDDNVINVLKNHQRLAKDLEYNYQKLVHMHQIHSDKIVIVEPKVHNFENPPECDALITNKAGIPLMVMTADCTPVLFYDPKQKIIAVAHAGRAGALKGIVPKTILKMSDHFGSDINDVLVVLGPSIGVCCYEVGKKIANEVIEKGYANAIVHKDTHYFLEVNTIIHQQLQVLGLAPEQIEDLSICNACQNETFFSYRADKQKTGRFAGVLMLKES
jgi:hypothetical protein